MTDIAQIPAQTRPAWLPWVMVSAIAANLFAIVAVNYWIYYARAAFIAAHPDYVAVQPPTISRAISDPAIGAPFAFWVTLSGILLVFGVFAIAFVHTRIARGVLYRTRRTATVTAVRIGSVAVVLCQAAASVGMYLLSSYRFPDHNAMHMTGSYMFFIAQALVIALALALCLTLRRDRKTLALLEDTGRLRRGTVLLRVWVGCISVSLSVFYMALFQAKGMDFGAANDAVYLTYVLVEPAVITSFLAVLTLFQFDLWAARRGQAAPGRGQPVSG